jgi:hypothetical protein
MPLDNIVKVDGDLKLRQLVTANDFLRITFKKKCMLALIILLFNRFLWQDQEKRESFRGF